MSIIYMIAAVLSIFALIAYNIFINKKILWFWVLFLSIFIVNIGYFALSISSTVNSALISNRIAYLGSVFLPVSMLMIILNTINLKYPKNLCILLVLIGIPVFLVTASPGYLDIYYEEVSLISVNGVSVLDKTYGSWHILYLFYLVGYFVAMIIVVLYATFKKKLYSLAQAIMLLCSVFINICVWLIEQFIDIEFEFLSISYIITEIFLIGVYALVQEIEKQTNKAETEHYKPSSNISESEISQDILDVFLSGLSSLTYTEKIIYDLYLKGSSTKEILDVMNITENTLKYHNKNIYNKLGVSSRKELKQIAKSIV